MEAIKWYDEKDLTNNEKIISDEELDELVEILIELKNEN